MRGERSSEAPATRRPKVALLGANGQVGSEVAAILLDENQVSVRGVVRSRYGMLLLQMLGVPCVVASLEQDDTLREALGDCDVVVDLTYPSGQAVDIPHAIERNTQRVMGAMRRGAAYVAMSSISAYGMGREDDRLRNHVISRGSYAAIKRRAEQLALRFGSELGIDVYIMRLGQVHGVLQGVTLQYREKMRATGLFLKGEQEDLSTTIFTHGVAQAITRCARGELKPTTLYTLVSNPQWTLSELVSYYARLEGEQARPSGTTGSAAPPGWARRVRGAVFDGHSVRDLAETHILLKSTDLYLRAKGIHRVRAAKADLAALRNAPIPSPTRCLVGPVPGPLVPGLATAPGATLSAQRSLEARLQTVLERARA